MDTRRIRKSHIEIPLLSQPRRYRPGSGPSLAPLAIALRQDTDAFIVERRILPGKAANGELKLEMCYVVGWSQLPAARVTIVATKIHDYVSPRTLEDWEYRQLLEKDKEREMQEAAMRRKAAEATRARLAAMTNTGTNTPKSGVSTPSAGGHKRCGRPSKAEVAARRLVQQSKVADMEDVSMELPPASTSGPSLSTPKKRLAEDIVMDVEDIDSGDQDDAIQRQLHNEEIEMEDMEMVDVEDTAGDESPTRAGISLGFGVTGHAHPIASDSRSSQLGKSGEHHTRKSSPLLAPSHSSFKKKPSLRSGNKVTSFTLSRQTPQLESPAPSGNGTTSIPRSAYITKTNNAPPPPIGTIQSSTVSTPSYETDLRNGSLPATESHSTPAVQGFTLAGRSSGRWPSESETPAPSPKRSASRMKAERTKPRKRTPRKATESGPIATAEKDDQAEETDEQAYNVKRLEGIQILEVDGKEERYFKVRWEGNWPPDQNPTWEPEANISAHLVKKYLKKKAAKIGGAVVSRDNGRRSTPNKTVLTRKYSSVAEAFEGGAEDELALSTSPAPWDRDTAPLGQGGLEDDDEGERLIVAEQQPVQPSRDASVRKRGLGLGVVRGLGNGMQHNGDSGRGGRRTSSQS